MAEWEAPAGDEEVDATVEKTNGSYLGSAAASIPYNDCSPISYVPSK